MDVTHNGSLFVEGTSDSFDFSVDFESKAVVIKPLIDIEYAEASSLNTVTLSEINNPSIAGEHYFTISVFDANDNLVAFSDEGSYSVASWPRGQEITGTKRQRISAGIGAFF